MRLNRLFQITAFVAVISAFVGCDEDFTEVGGEIINNPSNVKLMEFEVNAYSQKINSVETNNLSNFFLGVHEHPVYGQSVASVVSELKLSETDPDFGENVVLDSVVMTIPYFSSETEESTRENPVYKLDSIYGDGSFKLTVYETSFLLNNLDPEAGFASRQKYYTDQKAKFEQNIVGSPIYQNDNLEPSSASFVTYEPGEDEETETDTITHEPALRLKLSVDYFKNKIIDKQGSAELSSNDNFKNYLRNLYFKAEDNGSGGSQILFNMNSQEAHITLYYKSDVMNDADELEEGVRGSYKLNFFAGNKVNLYDGEYPADVLQTIQSQTSDTGAENIYLKGQEGSIAVIELFQDADELEALKEEELLINEANLTFYINESIYNGDQPNRLYLYDLTNNSILADYALDISLSVANPNESLTTFSTPLRVAEDENGSYYKIRITNHISNLLNGDAENVRLGLVVVPNINTVVSRGAQGSITGSLSSATRNTLPSIDRIPAATLFTPRGTVLHGNMSADEDKRLKLRIYYTDFN